MADNYQTESVGTPGATFASDDSGTEHWPYVKVAFGPDNTQTIVGSISSNPFPVALSSTDNAVLDSIQTAVEIIDNSVYVDDADWTALTSSHSLIGGIYQSTPGTITDGDTGPIRLDANGAIHINDGGNSITVDGTVTANLSATDNAVLDTIDAVLDTINAKLVSGTVIGDVNLGATDNAVLDTIAANTANLANCIIQDDSPFTPATGYLMMIGGEFDDAAPDSVDEGDAGNIRISANRNMYVQLRDAAGNERGLNVDALGQIAVTATDLSTIAGAVSGTEMQVDIVADGADLLTNTTFNAAFGTAGTADAQVLSVQGIASMTPLLVDATGQGDVPITLAGESVAISSLPASTNTIEVVGDVAHDAAAAGNPVAIAARATNSIEGLTQVAAADASYITSDLNGCLVTRPHTTLEENISERVADTAGNSTNLTNFAAGGAGIHNYITSATVYNSHASTSGYVDLRDGSAGSVLWTLPAPSTSGCIQTFDPPLKFSANTAVAYDVSAAISTVYISFNGFQAQG